MSSAVNVNETDGNFQNKVLNAVKFLTVLILSLTLSIYAPFSLAKEKGEERAQEIMETKNLPGFGESKVWTNPNLPDAQAENPDQPEVNVVSWNIERGYNVDEQMKIIQSLDADILCLQEVDIGCERTGGRNVALEIAAAAGFKYCAFTTQLVETDGDRFPKSVRGWVKKVGKGGGVDGVAILSKYPITGIKATRLHEQLDRKEYLELRVPSQGGRVAQKATIQVGNKKIAVYNTHLSPLDVGTTQKMSQWDKIADDAEAEEKPTIICGDFNTLGHGVAKHFAPKDPIGKMKRLFEDDSDLWTDLEFTDSKRRAKLEAGIEKPRRKRYTDNNTDPTYRSALFRGKLDYILLENEKISPLGNKVIKTRASDHDISVVKARID